MSILGTIEKALGIGAASCGTAMIGTRILWNPRATQPMSELQSLINNLATKASATSPYIIEIPNGEWEVGVLDATTSTYALYLYPHVSIRGLANSSLKSPAAGTALSLVLRAADTIVGTNTIVLDNIKAAGAAGVIIDICDSYAPTLTTNPVDITVNRFSGVTAAIPVRVNCRGIATSNQTLKVSNSVTSGDGSVVFTDSEYNNVSMGGTTPTLTATAAASSQTMRLINTYLSDTIVWAVAQTVVKIAGSYVGRVTDAETANNILRSIAADGSITVHGGQLYGNEIPSAITNDARFAAGTLYYCTSTDDLYVKVGVIGTGGFAAWVAVGSSTYPYIVDWDPSAITLQQLMDDLNTALVPTATTQITINVPPGSYDAELNAAADLELYPFINLLGNGGHESITVFATGAALEVDVSTNAIAAGAGTWPMCIEGIEIARALTGVTAATVNIELHMHDCYLTGLVALTSIASGVFTVHAADCVFEPAAGNHEYTGTVGVANTCVLDFAGCTIGDLSGDLINVTLHNCVFPDDAVWDEDTPVLTTYDIFNCTIGVDAGTGESLIAFGAAAITNTGAVITLIGTIIYSSGEPQTDCPDSGVLNSGAHWFIVSATQIPRMYLKLGTAAVDIWLQPGNVVEWDPGTDVAAYGASLNALLVGINAVVTPTVTDRVTVKIPPGRWALEDTLITLFPYIDLVGSNSSFFLGGGGTWANFIYTPIDATVDDGEIALRITGITFEDDLLDEPGGPNTGAGIRVAGAALTEQTILIFDDCIIRCPVQMIGGGLGTLQLAYENCIVGFGVLVTAADPHYSAMGMVWKSTLLRATYDVAGTIASEAVIEDCNLMIVGGVWSDDTYIHTTAATVEGTITIAADYVGVWTHNNAAVAPVTGTNIPGNGRYAVTGLAPHIPIVGDSVAFQLIGIPVNGAIPDYAAGGDVEIKGTLRGNAVPWAMHGANKYRLGTFYLCDGGGARSYFRKRTIRLNGPAAVEVVDTYHMWDVADRNTTVEVKDRFIGPATVALPADRSWHIGRQVGGSTHVYQDALYGGALCTLAGAAADLVAIDAGATMWMSTDNNIMVAARVTPQPVGALYATEATPVTNAVYIGLCDAAGANPFEGVNSFAAFRLEDPGATPATGNIYIVTRNAGGAVQVADTTINYVKGTAMNFRVDVSDRTNIRFFINEEDVSDVLAAANRTLNAAILLQPIVQLEIAAAAVGAAAAADAFELSVIRALSVT